VTFKSLPYLKAALQTKSFSFSVLLNSSFLWPQRLYS